jgi:small subunit ribosomal protein S18
MAFGGPKRGGPGGARGKDAKDAKGGDKRRGGGFFRRRKVCKFCADKIDDINYKDVKLLLPFVPERAKILPRRISGTCAINVNESPKAAPQAGPPKVPPRKPVLGKFNRVCIRKLNSSPGKK